MEESQAQVSNAPRIQTLLENDEIGSIREEEETQTQTTTAGKKRKKCEKRSPAWDDYNVIKIEEGNPPVMKQKGECKRCSTLIAANTTTNGTSALRKHTTLCLKRLASNVSQKQLSLQPGSGSGSATLTSWKFDQKDSRLALCEMIILDELPFQFVEKEGFKKFVARVCPDFRILSRQSIREDCVKLFLEKREILKSFFTKKGMGRVSITTDCWTAINNTNFICVTAHFIGKDWVLHKKIIAFRKIASHKGNDIGEAIVEVLKEWGLEHILCCTVDNASSNDGAVKSISNFLNQKKTNVLSGKYLHVRCVTHIINLIVSDRLEEIDMSVRRVREAVKWIKASPKRSDEFNKSVIAFVSTDSEKSLCLDVPTRWNSTYLMLESAEPFEAAFKVQACSQSTYTRDLNEKKHNDVPLGPPLDADWVNVRKMMEYLKTFYDFTLLVSGTNYVTAHLFFKEMCDIFNFISELELSDDDEVCAMARKMKDKVGKYWLEENELNPRFNKLLYIAALLDPQQKMKHVEMCLNQVYGSVRGSQLMAHVKDSMTELFEMYKKQLTASTLISIPRATSSASQSQATSSAIPSRLRHRSRRSRGSLASIPMMNVGQESDDISEMTIYFFEKQYVEDVAIDSQGDDDDLIDSFDILNWWMKNGARYPVLSEMARDILATLISTIASESAFSIGGRVLDQFRSSLTPKMAEALICSSNWLRTSFVFLNDEEDGSEEEDANLFGSVVTYLNVVGNESIHATTENLTSTSSVAS